MVVMRFGVAAYQDLRAGSFTGNAIKPLRTAALPRRRTFSDGTCRQLTGADAAHPFLGYGYQDTGSSGAARFDRHRIDAAIEGRPQGGVDPAVPLDAAKTRKFSGDDADAKMALPPSRCPMAGMSGRFTENDEALLPRECGCGLASIRAWMVGAALAGWSVGMASSFRAGHRLA